MLKKMKWRWGLGWVIGILLILGLLGCQANIPTAEGDNQPEVDHPAEEIHEELPADVVELTPESIELGNIRIEKCRRIELQEFLETTGVVSPDESRVAHIRPLARGVIETVYVRRGDRVKKGDPLMLYDNIELGEMIGEYLSRKAQLQRHLAEMEVARKFWERGVELLEAEAIARKEVELREAQFKNTQATVEGWRSEIAETEEKLHRFGLTEEEILGLDNHRGRGGHRTASHNTLRAPFSGVIIGYNVAEGELVEPTRELMMLADVSTVWVLADVYEKDLGQIREGRNVEIVSSTYPDEIFSGRLTYISDVLEKETRTARVRCVVSNLERLLKLEMFVTVRIPTIRRKMTLAVPQQAIQNIDGRNVVFVREDLEHFRSVEVETGLAADGWIEVSNLQEGAEVVSEGSFYLKSTLKRSEIEPEH